MKRNIIDKDIKSILKEINQKLDEFALKGLYDHWLPKKVVMRFFDYGETQMRQLENEQNLISSKIKARKFYSTKSILNLLLDKQNEKQKPV